MRKDNKKNRVFLIIHDKKLYDLFERKDIEMMAAYIVI